MTHGLMAHLDPEEIHAPRGSKGHQSNVAWKVQLEYMVFGVKAYGVTAPVENLGLTRPGQRANITNWKILERSTMLFFWVNHGKPW